MRARSTTHSTAAPGGATKWAEVDLSALRENVAALRGHVGGGVDLMVMVKANGFGHGAVLAARAALAGGARWLGVSCAEEALQLREAAIAAPILVTGWAHPALLPDLLRADVDVTVLDEPSLEAILAAARETGRCPSIHVKVDTGMVRLGVRAESADALLARLEAAGATLRISGVFTHFADAEADAEFTAAQDSRLIAFADRVRQVAPEAILHAANSAATLARPQTWHDLVRPGIAAYGYPPVAGAGVALRPAMTVLAHVSQVRTVSTGETVGYGRTWSAPGRRRVATVAAGYADGVSRKLSGRGEVTVAGRRCPIVGRVSMDQLTVDVSALEDVREGDVACLFGTAPGALDAAQVAAMIDTIPNDVLCAVPARLPRVAVGPDAPALDAGGLTAPRADGTAAGLGHGAAPAARAAGAVAVPGEARRVRG